MNIIEYAYLRKKSKVVKESDSFIEEIIGLMPQYVKETSKFVTKKKDQLVLEKSGPVKEAIITVNGEISVINEFESGKIYEPVIIKPADFLVVVEIILGMEEIISTNVAKTNVEYITIPKKIFRRWMNESHQLTKLVLDSVAGNFVKNMNESGENILLNSMYLLVNHIINFALYDNSHTAFVLQESRERTSIRTGINLRTLYRHLKQLKSDGLIDTKGRKILFDHSQKESLEQYIFELRNK